MAGGVWWQITIGPMQLYHLLSARRHGDTCTSLQRESNRYNTRQSDMLPGYTCTRWTSTCHGSAEDSTAPGLWTIQLLASCIAVDRDDLNCNQPTNNPQENSCLHHLGQTHTHTRPYASCSHQQLLGNTPPPSLPACLCRLWQCGPASPGTLKGVQGPACLSRGTDLYAHQQHRSVCSQTAHHCKCQSHVNGELRSHLALAAAPSAKCEVLLLCSHLL